MLFAPVFEPSEARYAAISANMARTGDWFVPSFTCKDACQPFAGKPPFAFQASALSCKAAEEWPWISFCFVDDGSTDATAESSRIW